MMLQEPNGKSAASPLQKPKIIRSKSVTSILRRMPDLETIKVQTKNGSLGKRYSMKMTEDVAKPNPQYAAALGVDIGQATRRSSNHRENRIRCSSADGFERYAASPPWRRRAFLTMQSNRRHASPIRIRGNPTCAEGHSHSHSSSSFPLSDSQMCSAQEEGSDDGDSTRPHRSMSLPEEGYIIRWMKRRSGRPPYVESESIGLGDEARLLEQFDYGSIEQNSLMLKDIHRCLRKAAFAERNGEIFSQEKERIIETLQKSSLDGDHDTILHVLKSLALTDEEVNCSNYDEDEKLENELVEGKYITAVEEELYSSRKAEEMTALEWSINHAAEMGAISEQLERALHTVIQRGALNDVRDVLFHKCHLVPAVQPAMYTAPTDQDHIVSDALQNVVGGLSNVETVQERYHKIMTLQELSKLVVRWVAESGRSCGLSEDRVSISGGALYVAGSYRFGLNDPKSDIDVVCVVPWHVTREDFFDSFQSLLRNTPGVSNITAIPHAFVPIMSIVYVDVHVDILFARLPRPYVAPVTIDIDADHVLAGLDAASVKSLNAPRTATLILSLVPNRPVFRRVLRAVRLWAHQRGIYSSKLGYLGGISWAILVAFVCQLYPKALPGTILCRFFHIMSEWPWPQPVLLSVVYDAGLGHDMWDPSSNVHDRMHLMPIITPSYPPMNSSVQVSHATFSVMLEEFWRARSVCDLINYQKLGQSAVLDHFKTLFLPSNFFVRYEWYLAIDVSATTESDMYSWGMFVESRLRKLVESLQHVSTVSRVHIFPAEFKTTSWGVSPGACSFIGLQFHFPMMIADPLNMSNLTAAIRFFLATDLQQFPSRKSDNSATTRLLSWEELPDFVFPQGRERAQLGRKEIEDGRTRTGYEGQYVEPTQTRNYANVVRNHLHQQHRSPNRRLGRSVSQGGSHHRRRSEAHTDTNK